MGTLGRSPLSKPTALEGMVKTLPCNWAPPGSRPIELVFYSCGESTSKLALQLALEHVKPDRVHVISGPKLAGLAVQCMPKIDYDCSHLVSMDANCLILEDLRPFLDANGLPMVGCYVRDRFCGRTYGDVHITRLDVIRAMCAVSGPIDSIDYVLNPEMCLRRSALRRLGFETVFKNFRILQDYFQRPSDIFATYARRELRSRTGRGRKHFAAVMSGWGDGVDFSVARHAVDHAAGAVPLDATPGQVERYLRDLSNIVQIEVQKLGIGPDQHDDIDIDMAMTGDPVGRGRSSKKFKVFGIGLSRTGTHSLTEALHVLGFDTVHYPVDSTTLETLMRGDVRFPLLEHYDGITDITTSQYFEDLDRAWPGSKFVLTVRDENSWLRSCRDHWNGLPAFRYGEDQEHRIWLEIRRFLDAAVYGSCEFNEGRFRRTYQHHVRNVTSYFAGRSQDLLILDISAGDGYEQLAPFLGMPVPKQPFPHGGAKGRR